MKKFIKIVVFSLITVASYAQSNDEPKKLKYVTKAPDGSVSMTIYDDTRDATMKLESASIFYKYEILNPSTNEAVYTSKNNGKECTIDKNTIGAGTYDLRLFTNKFVITSKIIVSASRSLASRDNQEVFAMHEKK